METKPTPRMQAPNRDIRIRLTNILEESHQAVQATIKQRQEEQTRESYWFKNQRWGSNYAPQAA